MRLVPPSVAFVLLVALLSGTVAAQIGFRVTHEIARTTPTHVEVNGAVTNEARAEALDVSVTVEAVGSNGKVVARGITYVAPSIPPGKTATFVAKVPLVPTATTYRAMVSAYRYGQSLQSP